ncbi:hypothetical protein OAV88_01845 [bacterium]|nr:hypothetical protein [bacterium]
MEGGSTNGCTLSLSFPFARTHTHTHTRAHIFSLSLLNQMYAFTYIHTKQNTTGTPTTVLETGSSCNVQCSEGYSPSSSTYVSYTRRIRTRIIPENFSLSFSLSLSLFFFFFRVFNDRTLSLIMYSYFATKCFTYIHPIHTGIHVVYLLARLQQVLHVRELRVPYVVFEQISLYLSFFLSLATY